MRKRTHYRAAACLQCGGHRFALHRGDDPRCSNECSFDHWAETGRYPRIIPALTVKRPVTEQQVAARRANAAKATAARLARIDGPNSELTYQRLGTAGKVQRQSPAFKEAA